MNNMLFNIFNLEEYYLIKNFGNFDFILLNKSNNSDKNIRLSYLNGSKSREILVNKDFLKQMFIFIRIYFNDYYFNIIIDNKKKFDEKDILKSINNSKDMRPVIQINLNINEFPITNYILKEKNKSNKDIDIDKVYIFEKPNNMNQINNNMINNNNRLERLLKEEKSENDELNKKISELENILNEQINKNSQLTKKVKELEAKLSRYPFELLEGEKIISVIFYSVSFKIHTSLICKNTDLFVNVEIKLYEEYPNARRNNNYFTVNGRRIDKYKSLKENNIKENDVILLEENIF